MLRSLRILPLSGTPHMHIPMETVRPRPSELSSLQTPASKPAPVSFLVTVVTIQPRAGVKI